jgi:hypothetical protein
MRMSWSDRTRNRDGMRIVLAKCSTNTQNQATKSSQPFEQLCQLHPEAPGELLHTQKRKVALSALYLPNVRPMQANVLLCSLLRPSPRFPQFADPLSECAL